MSRPGGAWPSSLRGGLPGISPHPRSPGVPWVWHDAPLRVFLLQRIGTLHTLYLFQKYDTATACCAAMTEGAAILHHPCDRTLQILIWRRCRGRSRIKAPRCWPTTPILPSKLWVRLSPLVPTRAVLSQPRLQQDRSDEIGQDCPESPEVLLLPKERGAPVAPTIGLNETIIAQDGDPGIPMSTARLFAEHCRKIIGFRVVLASSG